MNTFKAALAAVALCICTPVSAATIDESVVGDIPNFSNSVVGALGLGLTEVVGTISATCTELRSSGGCGERTGDFADTIGFTVAGGMQLTDVKLSITDLVVSGRSGWDPRPYATRGGEFRFNDLRGLPGDGVYDWLDVNIGAGDYGLGISADFNFLSVIGATADFGYTLSFTTQAAAMPPVPLMSSGGLLLSGLAAGAFVARRRVSAVRGR